MCPEIDKFNNRLFHAVYSIQYTFFEVKYFKADLFFKKNLNLLLECALRKMNSNVIGVKCQSLSIFYIFKLQ